MTYHCIERLKERASLDYDRAERIVANAKERGFLEELPHREREYLKRKMREGSYPLFYNGFIYIIGDNGKCITAYEAPQWFLKKNYYDGKIKVRNAKKYNRLHDVEDEYESAFFYEY